MGFEGGPRSQHSAHEGEVGEEGFQGGKMTREKERRGPGSDSADSAHIRERKEVVASWQVGEGERGVRGESEGPIRCAQGREGSEVVR